ncbi:MAG: S53 family peptidase [Candidatus Acidiferrales bacterium]
MKYVVTCLSAVLALFLLAFSPAASAQVHVMIPKSSLPQPPNASGQIMARTTFRILVPSNGQMNFGSSAQPSELPPFSGYLYETPASLGCIYNLVSHAIPGCNPNKTIENPSGGSRAIAIVDAFDDPTAASDLAAFSAQFGLPSAKFHVIYANGAEPAQDPTGGWEVEESLDVQWSHAMAPGATIYLVEAGDNSLDNLYNAVAVANGLVASAGGGQISMSWGSGEFTEETSVDPLFTVPGIVYVASAGDSPGVIYPSASPNVVSAGGTTVSRNINTGNFVLESSWQDAGGGPSQVEPRPSFQNGVQYIVGNARGTPDVSFDSNPNTGVWVYDSNAVTGVGWYIVGGTSVAAPSLSGIINSAGSFRRSSQAENQLIYGNLFNGFDFRDISYGSCGVYIGTFAVPGYDLCAGVGSPIGLRGK